MAEMDKFEARWNAMPEGKLELIDGRLIISSFKGSRRIAWCLLKDYGPPIAQPFAPAPMWWAALEKAFRPKPKPETPEQWWRWAETLEHDAEPPPAGPCLTGEHRCTYEALKWGLYYLEGQTHLGRALGRDFVVRLGDDGLTPDQIFILRRVSRLSHSGSVLRSFFRGVGARSSRATGAA